MKFSLALLVVGLASASAFAPSASFSSPKASLTKVNAEPEDQQSGHERDEALDHERHPDAQQAASESARQ